MSILHHVDFGYFKDIAFPYQLLIEFRTAFPEKSGIGDFVGGIDLATNHLVKLRNHYSPLYDARTWKFRVDSNWEQINKGQVPDGWWDLLDCLLVRPVCRSTSIALHSKHSTIADWVLPLNSTLVYFTTRRRHPRKGRRRSRGPHGTYRFPSRGLLRHRNLVHSNQSDSRLPNGPLVRLPRLKRIFAERIRFELTVHLVHEMFKDGALVWHPSSSASPSRSCRWNVHCRPLCLPLRFARMRGGTPG